MHILAADICIDTSWSDYLPCVLRLLYVVCMLIRSALNSLKKICRCDRREEGSLVYYRFSDNGEFNLAMLALWINARFYSRQCFHIDASVVEYRLNRQSTPLLHFYYELTLTERLVFRLLLTAPSIMIYNIQSMTELHDTSLSILL